MQFQCQNAKSHFIEFLNRRGSPNPNKRRIKMHIIHRELHNKTISKRLVIPRMKHFKNDFDMKTFRH